MFFFLKPYKKFSKNKLKRNEAEKEHAKEGYSKGKQYNE